MRLQKLVTIPTVVSVLSLISCTTLLTADSDAPSAKRDCYPAVSEEWASKVTSITDGDTIRVTDPSNKSHRIRLEGIDAPETGQAFSQKAKEALASLVQNKTVTIRKTGEDLYGRVLAYVVVDGIDVNAKLVEDGWAWHFEKYNCEERLAKLHETARGAKRGLWASENPLEPTLYRKRIAEAEEAKKAAQAAKAAQPLRAQ